jgi:glycosyltransferase involved in cell wall biosynthesis
MRILFVGNSGPVFLTHRLPLVLAALKAGYDVHVALPPSPMSRQIANYDFEFHEIPLSRSSINPFSEMISLIALYFLYRKIRPDIIHHVTLKPVLYGSLAANLAKIPAIVNTISGLGYVFVTNNFKANVLFVLVKCLFKISFLHPNKRVIFQNPENLSDFLSYGLIDKENTVLIKGSGVDTETFKPSSEPHSTPVVMVASRMLLDKGICEFVEAAREIKAEGGKARFVLVGDVDPENPMTITASQIKKWVDEDIIEWWGKQKNMPEIFSRAHIISLPSYAEGLPKVLIEASACGRPIVTTDVSGCRDTVINGENGILVPAHDSKALASAFRKLIPDPQLRQRMGKAGREIAVNEFSIEIVIKKTFAVYQDLSRSFNM